MAELEAARRNDALTFEERVKEAVEVRAKYIQDAANSRFAAAQVDLDERLVAEFEKSGFVAASQVLEWLEPLFSWTRATLTGVQNFEVWFANRQPLLKALKLLLPLTKFEPLTASKARLIEEVETVLREVEEREKQARTARWHPGASRSRFASSPPAPGTSVLTVEERAELRGPNWSADWNDT